jgi:hypothetical protein
MAIGMAGVILNQLPCSITPGGFSVVPNVLPNPLRLILGFFAT